MTPEEIRDEIIRLGREYVAEDPRRRVPMLAKAVQQPPGDAIAMPKTPETGPEIDEFAYGGMPSPPVQGTPGMPEFSAPGPNPYATIVLPGTFAGGPDVANEATVLGGGRVRGLPPSFSITDDPTVPIRDPSGQPARYAYPTWRETLTDIANAMQPGGGAAMALKGVAGAAHAGDAILGAGPTLRKGKKRGAITDIDLREMPLDEALEVVKTDPHLRKVNPKSDYVGGTGRRARPEDAAEDSRQVRRRCGGRRTRCGLVHTGAGRHQGACRARPCAPEPAVARAGPDERPGESQTPISALPSTCTTPTSSGQPSQIARTGQIARTYNQTRDISRRTP